MDFSETHQTFVIGQEVEKISGSEWTGRVVGMYSTKLTPEGYAVESTAHAGSVQIYPAKALRAYDAAVAAEREPLTDEQCDSIYSALDTWARNFDDYEFGLPMEAGGGKEGGREVIRRAIERANNITGQSPE